jgi:hypothetical protein
MSDEEQLLKVDAIGRVWASRERREALLDEFERSGTSAAQFAALTGVKYPTFASWVQKRRRTKDASGRAEGPLRWMEAVVAAPTSGLCVHLPCGARMEIADGAQAQVAAALLLALTREGRSC